MQAIQWKTEISATWKRALDLRDIRLASGGLVLKIEEESGKRWLLEFKPVQAWKVTAEECAGNIVSRLPSEGALFTMQESDWLQQLGDARPLQKSRHFMICCYDEVIEVLAWNCSITQAMQ
jgi:hypothetical protein